MSGEAASRARIDLPGSQAALLDAVIAAGKPTTILLFSGRPLVLPPAADRADALLACWFPGSEAGNAVADLLTGAAAPSAGLPVTWPRDVGQIPITYADRPGGRPEAPANKYTSKYLDVPNAPAFAFGHGLAYTRFTLSDPVVSNDRVRPRRDSRHQRRRPRRQRHGLPLHPRSRRPRRPPDARAPPLRAGLPRSGRDRDRSASRCSGKTSPISTPTCARRSSPAPSRSTSGFPPTREHCAPPASRSD